ncbi:13127_t:CDS:1, partial [Dentiscutata erythropus]
KEIDSILDNVSKLWKKNLIPEFKWNVHLYALLMFKVKIASYQEKWDRENKPLSILDQKKDEFKNIIDTRLQHGFSLVSEGHIIGDYLMKVVHKKAIKAGNLERIKKVKDIVWMTSNETVRLKYFEMLAIQVQNGDKKNAIDHFLCPKISIKNWFKHEVNSIGSNDAAI